MKLLKKMALADQQLVKNAANRVPICLCVDASYSMLLEQRIQKVNEGIRAAIQAFRENDIAADAIDLCVISFGGESAKIEIPFQTAAQVEYNEIIASGQTPMGQAVALALKAINERLEQYKDHGITKFKPWLILISDGEATDDISVASKRLLQMQRDRKIKVQCFGVGNERNNLASFHIEGAVKQLSDFELGSFFTWLSASAARLSCQSPYAENDLPDYGDEGKRL